MIDGIEALVDCKVDWLLNKLACRNNLLTILLKEDVWQFSGIARPPLYYVIGNCDAISYYIINAPRGCADRGDGVNCCAIPRSR